jgi:hypothetical protein
VRTNWPQAVTDAPRKMAYSNVVPSSSSPGRIADPTAPPPCRPLTG